MAKSDLPRGLTQGSAPHIWRYIPTPARRAAGWQSVTFLNDDKTHMTKGQALDAAEAINRLVEEHEAGLCIAGRRWAHLNPTAATGLPQTPRGGNDTIGVLLDAYIASDAFKSKSPATQLDMAGADRRGGRLNRLIETLAGHKEGRPDPRDMPAEVYARALADYDQAIQTIRNSPISFLVPEKPKKGEERERGWLEIAYGNLANMINERTGKPMITNAAAILRYTSMWLSWVIKEKGFLDRNPVQDVDVTQPEGRIAIWTQERIDATLKTCHAAGWHSIAFAMELSLELSWSQGDILDIRFSDIQGSRVRRARNKTGIKTETTLTEYGHDILRRIREHYTRDNGDNVTALPSQHLIRVDKRYGHENDGSVGKAWKKGYFRQVFKDLRNEAFADGYEGEVFTFQDLRDTAITRMWEAELDFPQIASRTQHSLKHIQNVIEKHYGKITRKISDAAAEKMNAYNAEAGIYKN